MATPLYEDVTSIAVVQGHVKDHGLNLGYPRWYLHLAITGEKPQLLIDELFG